MKLHRSRDWRRPSLVACVILAGVLMIAVSAVAATGPAYVPNEYIVKAGPGSTMSAVDQTIAQMGGSVVTRLPLADTYLVRMGTGGSAVKSAQRRLCKVPLANAIMSYHPNYLYHMSATTAVPNDPLFGVQWNMGLINMPQAWALQKGSASVTVAVIDSGVASHPDLLGRIVQGYDYVDNDLDTSNDIAGHGTEVAGVIAAQGDNSIGVAGVCWGGVSIMPIRIFSTLTSTASTAITLQGLDYALSHNADVVNMSYGFPLSDDLEQQKISDMAKAGIILCAAAGNFEAFVDAPARYPEVIAVSGVGPNDEFAYYSNYGPEVGIAAPGGDAALGPQAYITTTTVTWPNGVGGAPVFDYGPVEGTSFSCPHVAGAAALLLSASVPAGEVRSRLMNSARKPRVGTMDPTRYGAGILDMAAALTDGSVMLAKPIKGSTVTDNPDFKISVRGIDPNSLSVYLDYADGNPQDDLPDDLSAEIPVLTGRGAIKYLNNAGTAFLFNWADVSNTPLTPGLHFIYVTAQTSTGNTVFDWGTFSVSSSTIPRGMYLMALPYGSTISPADGLRHPLPQELLWDASTSQPLDFRTESPTCARLLRWSTPDGAYRSYEPEPTPTWAMTDLSWINLLSPSLNVPTGGGYLGSNMSTLQYPAGAGFWLILQSDAVLSNAFPTIAASAGLQVPLYKGWNLIGNPFTHSVPMSQIKLIYQGAMRTLDEDQAKKNPWLQLPASQKSQFYGYSSDDSGYVAVPWRDVLEPYQGYWVRALVGGTTDETRLLIVLQ